jgi:hypothetical protein
MKYREKMKRAGGRGGGRGGERGGERRRKGKKSVQDCLTG